MSLENGGKQVFPPSITGDTGEGKASVLDHRFGTSDPYTIGVEVLRRDIKFDPQLDPIVRVEATRLRRAIERYYSGPGADDPLTIVASRWRCSAC